MGKSISVNGQRLKELRVERALTLRALGERSGVAYGTINKSELSRRPAQTSTIHKLADALGVEPKELIKGDGAIGTLSAWLLLAAPPKKALELRVNV